MKLLKERDANGFFTVSNAFTDTFLGLLSGDAVKLYLYVKRCQSEGNEFFPADASAALRITKDACESALEELTLAGVAVIDGGNIILRADSSLKDAASGRFDEELRKKLLDREWESGFREVVRSINDEFFAGRMNGKWYDLIKKCAGEYGFQPETVYILFASCKNIRENSSVANFYSYIAKVAENWYADRIVTPEDVAEREKRAGAAREFIGFVSKKLNFRRPFTAQEQTVVLGWQAKGVTPEMLSVLLDDTNRIKGFTISKIDGEVRKWTEAGLKTPADVKNHYDRLRAERASQNAKKTEETKNGTKDAVRKHYSGEREYDENFFKWLEDRDRKDEKKD